LESPNDVNAYLCFLFQITGSNAADGSIPISTPLTVDQLQQAQANLERYATTPCILLCFSVIVFIYSI